MKLIKFSIFLPANQRQTNRWSFILGLSINLIQIKPKPNKNIVVLMLWLKNASNKIKNIPYFE